MLFLALPAPIRSMAVPGQIRSLVGWATTLFLMAMDPTGSMGAPVQIRSVLLAGARNTRLNTQALDQGLTIA